MGFGIPTITNREQVEDKNPDLYVRRAEDALRKHEINNALNEIDKAIEFGNQSPCYKFEKAKILFACQSWEECIKELNLIKNTGFGHEHKKEIKVMLKTSKDNIAKQLPLMQWISYQFQKSIPYLIVLFVFFIIPFSISKYNTSHLHNTDSEYQDYDVITEDDLTKTQIGYDQDLDEIQNNFIDATDRQDLKEMRSLLSLGADPNNSGNNPALIVAVKNDDYDLAQELINAGAHTDVQDEGGVTALMYLCAKKNRSDIKPLLNVLVDTDDGVNIADDNGESAIFYAVKGQNRDTIKFLIEHFADLNVTDNNGLTPLKLAANTGNLEIIQFLIQKVVEEKSATEEKASQEGINREPIMRNISNVYLAAGEVYICTDPRHNGCLYKALIPGDLQFGGCPDEYVFKVNDPGEEIPYCPLPDHQLATQTP